jgi:hypothetical protein
MRSIAARGGDRRMRSGRVAPPEDHEIGAVAHLLRVGRHGPGPGDRRAGWTIEVTRPEVDRRSERLGEVARQPSKFDRRGHETGDEYSVGTGQLRGSDFEFAGGGWRPAGCHDFGSTQMLR